MRFLLLVSLWFTPCFANEDEDEVFVLPEWSEEDLRCLEAGEGLANPSLFGRLESEFQILDEESAIEPDPSVRYLPDDFPEDNLWSTDIPPELVASYFDQGPKGFLNDPQGLLATQEFRDRETFLNYHARDTEVNLYIYLFDALQEIPPSESIEKVVGTHFDPDQANALVFYFLGMPEKSLLVFTDRVSDVVPEGQREGILRRAISDALEKSDPSSQLEAFSIQLSIRLYWLERTVKLNSDGTAEASPSSLLGIELMVDHPQAGFLEVIKEKPIALAIFFMAVVVLPTIVLALVGRWIAESRRLYLFPDAEGSPLLGAPYAAGVGGVISFSSTTVPPSLQRKEVPDYLTRL